MTDFVTDFHRPHWVPLVGQILQRFDRVYKYAEIAVAIVGDEVRRFFSNRGANLIGMIAF